MHSRLMAFGSALLLAATLTTTTVAQESAGEKRREHQMDTAAAGNAYKEPHMTAALSHLRQAEEELEKANAQHGGYRLEAIKQVQQAESTVTQGIQWYNANVLNKNNKDKK